MTNELSTERAIEALYTVRAYYASLTAGYPKGKDCRGIGDVMCSEIANSCLMAIKALEQQPCEDCISREAVKEMLTAEWTKYMPMELDMNLSFVLEKISELPSITPKAKWIPCSERLPKTDDYVLCWYEYYHWSREKVLPEYGIGGYSREISAWFGEVANGKDVRVIAWMPLPQPYKAESEKCQDNYS